MLFLTLNKKSLWIQVSGSKLLGDWSSNIKMRTGFFGQNLHVKNRKSKHYHWILNIRVSLGTKFQLKLTTILIFWTRFALKRHFCSKVKKSEHHPWCQITTSTDNFDFLDQICLKRVLLVEHANSEHHQWIWNIRISLGTYF